MAFYYTFYLAEKQICILHYKEMLKNHLKIFLFKLNTENDHLYFQKNTTSQTFIFISGKVIYFKKHLIYQVYHPYEAKFPLPLNVRH